MALSLFTLLVFPLSSSSGFLYATYSFKLRSIIPQNGSRLSFSPCGPPLGPGLPMLDFVAYIRVNPCPSTDFFRQGKLYIQFGKRTSMCPQFKALSVSSTTRCRITRRYRKPYWTLFSPSTRSLQDLVLCPFQENS